jgi:hypothetical protein
MIDKGYYKDIPQLAKPKGNQRQGFRGDDAYGSGDQVAGGGDQGNVGDKGDGPSRNVTTKSGDTFAIGDPTIDEKVDFFDRSYVEPGPFGIGGGYRETVLPNTTQYGNKSRLGSLVASGIGTLAGFPGLGFLSNIGPFNNRAFYDTKVLDAGKLDTSKYKDFDAYLEARMAGEIDAYGNPINSSGGGISTLPLFTQTPVSTNVETLEEEPQEMSFLERLRQNLGLV